MPTALREVIQNSPSFSVQFTPYCDVGHVRLKGVYILLANCHAPQGVHNPLYALQRDSMRDQNQFPNHHQQALVFLESSANNCQTYD